MTTLGFLGTGTMGAAMANRLVAAGHDVVVWNRSPGAVDALVTAGARRAETPAEALAAPFSFSMLANDAAALAVLGSAELVAGTTHVSMASLSPDAVRTLAGRAGEAGVRFVAAPVLGRPNLAADGLLNILAAGDAAAIAELEPFFSALGRRTWPLGEDPARAAVVKIAMNYNIIHAIQAIGESMTLVEANGVASADFAELLSNTLFGGVAYTGYSDLIARRAYRPAGFSMALGRKDLGLAEEVASGAGFELPTSAVIRGLFDAALADEELAESDWAALAEMTRRRLPGGTEGTATT